MSDEVQRKHPLAKCEECPLQVGGRFVPSEGPEHAKVAFVGEAPGKQEAKGGRPFTGPSGQLLDVVLKHHGIKREEVFLSNATLCRPADGSTPTKTAILACRDRLDGEVQERGVETLVALGNSAAESTLGASGVFRLRVGPGRDHARLPGVRVITTVHPAACLRQADMFPNLITDIGKVVHSHAVFVEPAYFVADTVRDAMQVLSELEQREGPLVVDIEADIEKDTSFDHPDRYGMLCIGIGYAPGRAVVFGEGVMGSEEVLDRLGDLLSRRKLIGQNLKFDLAGLYPVLGGLKGWFDTMLASYVFDERGGIHGLKVQATEILGAPDYSADIKKYVGPGVGYGAIPRDKLYKYNAYDLCCTYGLWQHYEAKFEKAPELRRVHDFLMAAANELMYIELNGIGVDREYLDVLQEKYLDSLEGIEENLNKIIKGRNYDKRGGLNPRSPMQVKAYFHDHGINVDSTDKDVLALLLTKLEPDGEVFHFVETLLVHRRETKMYGTYVKGIRKRLFRGRVYPTFLLHGTTTGRLACRNPNMQNIPRESAIRQLFVPTKPENVFLQVDYAQAELRVLSYLAGDTYFRDIFNGGERDLFDELTPVLYPDKRRVEMSAAEWKELRIRVKAFVYGLSYGREAGSIATEFKIPRSDALKLQANFFSVIPEIVTFREETRAAVMAGQDLITPLGRHRRYMLITKENVVDVMNEALAFLPQSTASDMCLKALTVLRPELRGKAFIRNTIHDALLLECHADVAEEVASLVDKRMVGAAEEVVQGYVKFATDYKIGKHWGEV